MLFRSAALARYAARGKQHLVLVRPIEEGLALEQLYYADEIRAFSEVPVDEAILAAGDHNGSTYHQHMKFLDVVHGKGSVEVGLDDGIWSVRMGQAAQESARTGTAVTL